MKKILATVLVASMALFTFNACDSFNQGLNEGMLEGYVELANEDLPEVIDEGYTLDSAICIDNTVIYHFTVTSDIMEGIKLSDEQETHNDVLSGLVEGYSNEDQKKFLDIVIKAQGDIKYIWMDETGEEYEVLISCDELKAAITTE